MFVKIFSLFNKKGYIKENTYCNMNLKERGITVGDILIIFLIILTTTLVVKSFKKDKGAAVIHSNQEYVFYKKNLLS